MSATQSRADELREAKHPVYSDRTLRLGTFSSNLSHGCAISTIDGVLSADWPSTASLAAMSDAMEFEALVPVGRVPADAVARLRERMEATEGLIEDARFTDVARWAEVNAAFHEEHVAMAGSVPLSQAYRRLSVAGLIVTTYTGSTVADPELAGDHRRLVEAYERGEVEAARQAVREHADRAASNQRAAIAAGEGAR